MSSLLDVERHRRRETKGENAERGDHLWIKSWACCEEQYDCHLTDGVLSNDLSFVYKLTICVGFFYD